MPPPYDHTASWDSPNDCLRAIAIEPPETHLDLLLATVRFNITCEEFSFASELVRDSESLFA
jgi:hypothetical protein